jgi:hypothetical protein
MRLAFIFHPERVNSTYRALIPMRGLAARGHEIVRPDDLSQDTPMRQLLSCDLVHCFRRHDRLADLKRLSRQGVAVSFDNDDDLGSTDVIAGKASLDAFRSNRRYAKTFEKAAQLADLVTTPSQALAERYRAAGAQNVTVIENYLDGDAHHFGRRTPHHGVVVGWVAALEHAADLPHLKIVEALSRLLETHARLRILTVGVRLPLRSDRYEHIQSVPIADLLAITARIDIGIAPLVDNAFNRSRSNVKLKEYGAGGAAWLASPVDPYRELGPQQGGRLVRDDGWFAAIDELVRSRLARARLSRRALRWAKGQTIDRHAFRWEHEFQRAIERAQERMSRPVA